MCQRLETQVDRLSVHTRSSWPSWFAVESIPSEDNEFYHSSYLSSEEASNSGVKMTQFKGKFSTGIDKVRLKFLLTQAF